MDMLVVPKVRRRVIEVGPEGIIVLTDLDGVETRIVFVKKSGKKSRVVVEAPETVKIDHAG